MSFANIFSYVYMARGSHQPPNKGVCYNCGKPGHIAKNCKEEKKTTPVQVYTMSKKEAKDLTTVVSGTYNLQLSTFIN